MIFIGANRFDYPMGHLQLLGKVNKDMIALDAPVFAPDIALEEVAKRLDWWLTSEDLPILQSCALKETGFILLYR